MMDAIKKALRISHNMLDDDIQRNIDACLLDLERVGVDTSAQDGLLIKACELYCKAEYDFAGKGELFKKNYEALRDALSVAGGHYV